MEIPEIDVAGAVKAHEAGETVFVDIRDPDSYAGGHIPGAVHLHDGNVGEFLRTADRKRDVIVYCFHGNNSIGGTAFFLDQGFTSVRSLQGGFEMWAAQGPVERAEPGPA